MSATLVLATLACTLAEAGTISVDGMLDDWEGVVGHRAGGKDKDQSFEVRCIYDGKKLAISFDVRDDKLVRLYKAKGKLQDAEDHLKVKLGSLALRLWPGTERHAPRRQMMVTKKGKTTAKATPKWLAIEDTQQPKGWSIELELPVAKLAGWNEETAELDTSVTFVDADSTEEHTSEPLADQVTLGLDGGTRGGGTDLYAKFLKDARLKKSDVKIDEKIGGVRVVGGGTVLGIIGKSYSYVTLPVDSASDVLAWKLVWMNSKDVKTRQVLTVLRQSGGGGTRDIVAVWSVDGGVVEQLFAVEIRKEADGNLLESTWQVRSTKGKWQELKVQSKTVLGWDEDTFEEEPADDAESIHLPWDDARLGGIYWLDGSTMRSRKVGKLKK